MFNAGYALWNKASSGSTYLPNCKSKSALGDDHVRWFKFIGRIIGKALYDECLLECYFVKSFYKIITGETLMFSDLEDYDNDFFKGLTWMINNDVDPL